jgi:colanic acid/amylovoran biosynthesis glycosyltransferase
VVGDQEVVVADERAVKIAFLVGRFPILSETFVLNQITSLIERGHDVSIFAECEGGEPTAHPDVDRFGLRERVRYERMPEQAIARAMRLPAIWTSGRAARRAFNPIHYGRDAASLRLPWTARFFQDAPAFDVIHCHFGALGLKAALAKQAGALRGSIVTAFHGEDVINYPKRFRPGLYSPLFERGDLFLPISARWNDSLIAMGCPPARIRVHRMGVDLRRFVPRSPGSHERVRIVTVGRLVEKKGIEDAIMALSMIKAPFEYLVAGEGPLRGRLEALARERLPVGAVQFLGAQTQDAIVPLLHSADIFLAPSVTGADGDIEGIPVSIMEAMALGLPVVSTFHSGIPELVSHGVSGLLLQEHDIAGLSTALSALIVDPDLRARLGVAGRGIVAAQYDVATLTDRLVDLYREAIGRRS